MIELYNVTGHNLYTRTLVDADFDEFNGIMQQIVAQIFGWAEEGIWE